ncbi:hypothetical protein V6N13_004842 [Hibiscus sabdariffa]
MTGSPGISYVKFNVDVVAKEGIAGRRGILRTEEGVLRAIFLGPMERLGNDFTELIAIKTVLYVFNQAKWTDVF